MEHFDLKFIRRLFVLVGLTVIFGLFNANAQVRKEFAPRFPNQFIRGDFSLFGNSNVQLSETGQDAHNGLGVTFIDIDEDDQTANSSSAMLVFSNENGAAPACTEVLFAGLYWSGRAQSNDVNVPGSAPNGDWIGDRFQKNKIKLKKSGNNYVTIEADDIVAEVGDPSLPETNRGMYVAFADVTDYVKEHKDGVYYVADIATTEGPDASGTLLGYCGGWGLVVVYQNPVMNPRNVVVFDGYAFVQGGTADEYQIDIDGFLSNEEGPVNVKLGVMAGEGDRIDFGDYLSMYNKTDDQYIPLSHSLNTPDNFFNSTILTDGVRNPELVDNAGTELAVFTIPNDQKQFIGNRDTETSFRYSTRDDSYVIYNLTFSVDAFVPVVEPINQVVSGTSPGGVLAAGDEVELRLEIKNRGNEAIRDGIIELPIPDFVDIEVLEVSNGEFPQVADGKLVWNVSDIGLNDNQEEAVAWMAYKLVVKDCEALLAESESCTPVISLNGRLTGFGAVSGQEIEVPFIKGFGDSNSPCVPEGDPIYGEITYTIDLSGCFVFSGATNLTVCDDEQVDIVFNSENGSITEYIWTSDNTDIGIAADGEGNISFVARNETNQTILSTVTVIPKSRFGCEGLPVTFTIVVNPLPDASFEGAEMVCSGSTITMTPTNPGGVWTSSDESVAIVDADGIVTALAAGTATISYSLTNEGECSAQVSREIVVRADCEAESTKIVEDESGDRLAQAGEILTYTISVSSTYDREIQRVIVDEIPDHTTLVDGSISNGGNYDAATNTITWNHVVVPAESSVNVTFQVKVDDDLTGVESIRNVAAVTGDDPEEPEEPEVEIPTDPVKSFRSEKTADKQSVKAGEELTYTITVTNTGDVDYDGITVEDNIPANTSYKAGSANDGGSLSGTTLTWTVDVPFGGSRAVSFTVVVGDDLTDVETIRNAAVVTGDDPDTPDEPEVETPTDPVKSFRGEKTADKQSVKAGEELTYTITVTNTGDVDYDGITISDAIPANTTYKEGSANPAATLTNNVLTWTVDVPFGGSRAVSFTVVVDDDLTGVETIRNAAVVTGDDPDTPDEPEVETPTDPVKSFRSEKTADRQSVKAGDELTYTIRVTNTGDVDYDGITVEDNIPANTSYKAGSASDGGSLVGTTLMWTVDVPFGESREVGFTVVVDDDLTGVESIRNVAKVTGEDPETPEEPETETPTGSTKHFESNKTVSDATGDGNAQAGEELTYRIHVKNTGSENYNGITIEDEIPAYTTYVTGSATNGGVLANGKLSWTIDVPYGEEVSVSFNVRVVEDVEGVDAIRNVATVTGGDPENPEVERPKSPDVPVITGPTAEDDNGTTNQGEPITITVLTNDAAGSSPLDPESVRLIDPLTGDKVTTVTIAGEGTYTVTADGKVTFTPDPDYVGNSTINYTVKDENGLESNEGTISIVVEGVAAEIAPTAIDDQATTPYGQAVTIPVLNNDQVGSSPIVPSTVKLIDENGNRVTTVTIPGEGRYQVNAQGIVTFEPAENFTGTSTVTYEVSDENGLVSNIANITVNVSARQFKIPNVFTPNGDGRNDVFEIVGIENFDRVEITVVNRWGNEVYRNNNYRNNWNGQGLNEGTYYYVIVTHDGGRQERHAGWVLIKRQ